MLIFFSVFLRFQADLTHSSITCRGLAFSLWLILGSFSTFERSITIESGAIMEPQTMKGLQYQPAHLHDDRSSILYATGGLMMLLTSVAILLRLCCRQKLRASIGPDDRTILTALVS